MENYVNNGVFKNKTANQLVKGGTYSSVDANAFVKPDNDGEGYYVIGYFDAGGGVLFYDYMYVPSSKEALEGLCAVGVGFGLAELGLIAFALLA